MKKLFTVAPLVAALAAGTILVPVAALAQSSGATPTLIPAPAAAAPALAAGPAGFQAGGIKAVVASVAAVNGGVAIQFIIQNLRPYGIYLTLVSGYGGSSASAMSTDGGVYYINNYGAAVQGVSECTTPNQNISSDDNIKYCMGSFPVERMVFVDANQSTILGITYSQVSGPTLQAGSSISFALKFIVRSAGSGASSLASGTGSSTGSSDVATISFPLIPIKQPSAG